MAGRAVLEEQGRDIVRESDRRARLGGCSLCETADNQKNQKKNPPRSHADH
jgi:hypothetical protein